MKARSNGTNQSAFVVYDAAAGRVTLVQDDSRSELKLRAQARALIVYMDRQRIERGGADGILCSRDELRQAVWPSDSRRRPEEVARLVWEIRKELRKYDADDVLENERGVGYRLRCQPPPTVEDDRTSHLPRPSRRHVAVTAVVGMLAVALGAATYIATAGATGTRMKAYALPVPTARPLDITVGPQGDLWFTEYDGNEIGRITPSGQISVYPIPTANSGPEDIVAGPRGKIWFAEGGGNKIGFINQSGSIVEYPLPHANSRPESLAVTANGTVWFTEDVHRIGRLSPDGNIREFNVPPSLVPDDIAVGAGGDIWFDSSYTGPGYVTADDRIGRMTPTGKLTVFHVPTRFSAPSSITRAPDGDLWVVEGTTGKLARITPDGIVTEYTVAKPTALPAAIAIAPNGNVWFTLKAINKIACLTPAGKLRFYSLPTPAGGPRGITIAPDGAIWFTEIEAGKIGRFLPPSSLDSRPSVNSE